MAGFQCSSSMSRRRACALCRPLPEGSRVLIRCSRERSVQLHGIGSCPFPSPLNPSVVPAHHKAPSATHCLDHKQQLPCNPLP